MGEQADPFAVSAIGRLWPSGPVEGGDEVADPSGSSLKLFAETFVYRESPSSYVSEHV